MHPSDPLSPWSRFVSIDFGSCETLPFWNVRMLHICSEFSDWKWVSRTRFFSDGQTTYSKIETLDPEMQSPLRFLTTCFEFPCLKFPCLFPIGSFWVLSSDRAPLRNLFRNPLCTWGYADLKLFFPNFEQNALACPLEECYIVLCREISDLWSPDGDCNIPFPSSLPELWLEIIVPLSEIDLRVLSTRLPCQISSDILFSDCPLQTYLLCLPETFRHLAPSPLRLFDFAPLELG